MTVKGRIAAATYRITVCFSPGTIHRRKFYRGQLWLTPDINYTSQRAVRAPPKMPLPLKDPDSPNFSSLGLPESNPKRHLDWFGRFLGLKVVTNTKKEPP